jgi:cytochrome c peroxidase
MRAQAAAAWARAVWAAALYAALCAAPASPARAAQATPPVSSDTAQLGRQIFFDPGLSASGRLSCAGCHSPSHAYSSPEGGLAPRGGARLDRPPLRTVPSLRYLDATPRFTRHYYLDHGTELEDEGAAGGFMLDGRADSLHAQALIPWLDAAEMGNRDMPELAQRLQRAPYALLLRQFFGARVFEQPRQAVAAAALAVEQFELQDPSFHPYSSRYDAYLAGSGALSDQELRGLRLFTDPRKGNCAECHPSSPGAAGRAPDFTDYAYHALGVPRNLELAANADPNFYDLGLCGPRRHDLQGETAYCGYFKTPTLRNTAHRRQYFHNGRFTTLEQVLRFYAERDTAPQRWYPMRGGRVDKFDDLPQRYRSNVDSSDGPLDRQRGQPPALAAADIDDLAAFLRTLDDAD